MQNLEDVVEIISKIELSDIVKQNEYNFKVAYQKNDTEIAIPNLYKYFNFEDVIKEIENHDVYDRIIIKVYNNEHNGLVNIYELKKSVKIGAIGMSDNENMYNLYQKDITILDLQYQIRDLKKEIQSYEDKIEDLESEIEDLDEKKGIKVKTLGSIATEVVLGVLQKSQYKSLLGASIEDDKYIKVEKELFEGVNPEYIQFILERCKSNPELMDKIINFISENE